MGRMQTCTMRKNRRLQRMTTPVPSGELLSHIRTLPCLRIKPPTLIVICCSPVYLDALQGTPWHRTGNRDATTAIARCTIQPSNRARTFDSAARRPAREYPLMPPQAVAMTRAEAPGADVVRIWNSGSAISTPRVEERHFQLTLAHGWTIGPAKGRIQGSVDYMSKTASAKQCLQTRQSR